MRRVVRVEVWHEKSPTWGDEEKPFTAEHFRHVATVEADTGGGGALDEAFRLTNSIHRPWWTNEGVTAHVGPARSTSAADVAVVGSVAYRCCAVGWSEVQG